MYTLLDTQYIIKQSGAEYTFLLYILMGLMGPQKREAHQKGAPGMEGLPCCIMYCINLSDALTYSVYSVCTLTAILASDIVYKDSRIMHQNGYMGC